MSDFNKVLSKLKDFSEQKEVYFNICVDKQEVVLHMTSDYFDANDGRNQARLSVIIPPNEEHIDLFIDMLFETWNEQYPKICASKEALDA